MRTLEEMIEMKNAEMGKYIANHVSAGTTPEMVKIVKFVFQDVYQIAYGHGYDHGGEAALAAWKDSLWKDGQAGLGD